MLSSPGLPKVIRERLGLAIGDEVEIALVEADEPREVVVPANLQAAMDDARRAVTMLETGKRSGRDIWS